MTKTVWVVGASGLVGRHVTDVLLADPRVAKVVTWVRTPTGQAAARLEEHVIDFEQFEEAYANAGARPELAVCALGTTIKTAGSRERFRRVDHDYVLAFARAALKQGARALAVVTALGADPRSAIFYNRVKGEVEQDLSGLGFESLNPGAAVATARRTRRSAARGAADGARFAAFAGALPRHRGADRRAGAGAAPVRAGPGPTRRVIRSAAKARS